LLPVLLPSDASGVVLIVATLCCVIAQIAILRTVRATVTARVSPDRRPSTVLETIWAVLPILALTWILVTAWRLNTAQRVDAPTRPVAGIST
jgi:heme/copper-type cytochrome/quinol oxidase subunit 2